eukprot:6179829-Pleurochrysis_carterae.AAC.1
MSSTRHGAVCKEEHIDIGAHAHSAALLPHRPKCSHGQLVSAVSQVVYPRDAYTAKGLLLSCIRD